MVVVWIPVVFFVFAKVLLMPEAPFHWEKTDHGLYDTDLDTSPIDTNTEPLQQDEPMQPLSNTTTAMPST